MAAGLTLRYWRSVSKEPEKKQNVTASDTSKSEASKEDAPKSLKETIVSGIVGDQNLDDMRAAGKWLADQYGKKPSADAASASEGTVIPGMAGVYDEKLGEIINEWKEDTQQRRSDDRTYKNNMILYGPTGNGKTTLVNKLAEQTGSKLIVCSGSKFVDKYVGGGAAGIREAFEEALRHAERTGERVIIFIDEIDAFAANKDDRGNSAHESQNTQIELWTLLDKYADDNRIFIIGATNHFDRLDPRMQRRFERGVIKIPNPDAAQREAIFKYHFDKMQGVTLEEICSGTCKEDLIKNTAEFGRADLEEINIEIKRKKGKEGKITPTLIEQARKHIAERLVERNRVENEQKAKEARAERRETLIEWGAIAGIGTAAGGALVWIITHWPF